MSTIFRRIALVFLLVLALLITAGFLFTRFWLDDYLKDQLIGITERGSRQLYALQMERLHVNIFTGSAEVDGIQLRTDSIRWETMKAENAAETPLKIDLAIRRLRIGNFWWVRYWRSKDLSLSEIEILEPQLNVRSVKDTVLEKDPKTDTLTKGILDRLPQLLAPHAKSLHIGSLSIYNGKIAYRTSHLKKSTYQQADSIDWILSNVNIVASDTSETGKALYADNILLKIKHYELYPPDKVYVWRFQEASVVGQDERVELKDFSIQTLISDREFDQRLTIRKVRLKFKAEKVTIRKLNLFRALHKQEWSMASLAVEDGRLSLYQNKNLPPKPNKKMPNEMFRDLPFYLNIDTVSARNLFILYTEVIDDGKGLITFEHSGGTILNVTNDSLKMSDETPARIQAQGQFMGEGLLTASVNLPLLAKSFRCNYRVTLGAMDMTFLNRLLTPKDHLRIDEGKAEKIILEARAQDGVAQGTLQATYENLKVSLLDDDSKRKKKVLSLVANLLIRGNNTRERGIQPFKVGEVYYPREPGDGFIRFLWRSAQTGLMKTLLPERIKIKPKD